MATYQAHVFCAIYNYAHRGISSKWFKHEASSTWTSHTYPLWAIKSWMSNDVWDDLRYKSFNAQLLTLLLE